MPGAGSGGARRGVFCLGLLLFGFRIKNICGRSSCSEPRVWRRLRACGSLRSPQSGDVRAQILKGMSAPAAKVRMRRPRNKKTPPFSGGALCLPGDIQSPEGLFEDTPLIGQFKVTPSSPPCQGLRCFLCAAFRLVGRCRQPAETRYGPLDHARGLLESTFKEQFGELGGMVHGKRHDLRHSRHTGRYIRIE